MEKNKYIEQELLKMIQSMSKLVFVYGGVAILSLCILDYIVTPEDFPLFFKYRIITAVSFVGLFYSVRLKQTRTYLIAHIFIATFIVSAMVELMVFSLGGHQSPYYVGLILVFIFVFGLLPVSLIQSLLLTFLIYAVYLVPILLFDDITNIVTTQVNRQPQEA